ncbi:MAG: flagellar type III secretion system pore protein FliP [Opitutales bacterium]
MKGSLLRLPLRPGFSLTLLSLLFLAVPADAQNFRIDVTGGDPNADFGVAIQLVVAMTLLTLGPSVIMMMTTFTRIVIVLGFVRNAVGVNAAPSSQIIIGVALFLTFFLMGPVWNRIYEDAVVPYMADEMRSGDALETANTHMKDFMLNQTRRADVNFFLELSRQGAMTRDELPLSIVVPSFVLSELRTAFQMGFLIFIPFIIVDFIVASSLMSMGMMMMPPVVISMPFKLLLFVLVDGWYLVVQSLVDSFNV